MTQPLLVALLTYLALTAACIPVPPVVVPDPTPPVATVRAVAVVAQDARGGYVQGAQCELQVTPTTWLTASGDGYVLWPEVSVDLRQTHLRCMAEGYREASEPRKLLTGINENLDPLTMTPELVPLPRLVQRGSFFQLETGEYWSRVGLNEHQLLDRWISDRPGYEATLAQRESIQVNGHRGFNTLRVFSMCYRRVNGQNTPCPFAFDDAYYVALRAMLDDLNARKWYVDLTVFGSAPALMPDPAQQQRHWRAVGDAVRGATNTIVNLGNELDGRYNKIDVPSFPRLSGLTLSRGSSVTREPPQMHAQPWDFELYHTNSAPEWTREAHNAMEFSQGAEGISASRKPIFVDENKRYPDDTDNLNDAYDAASVIALLTAGGDYHCDHCRFSEPWDATEFKAAQEWANGAWKNSWRCQDGPYRHRQDLEGPNDLRIYERPVPGYSCIAGARR